MRIIHGRAVDVNPMVYHQSGLGDEGDTPAPSTYSTPAGPQPVAATPDLTALQSQVNATADVVEQILTGQMNVGQATTVTPTPVSSSTYLPLLLIGGAAVVLMMMKD
jgi:hypothetical protein